MQDLARDCGISRLVLSNLQHTERKAEPVSVAEDRAVRT